jgi:hypothetical protein
MARKPNKWNGASRFTLPLCGQEVLVRMLDPIEMELAGMPATRLQQLGQQLIESQERGDGALTPEQQRAFRAALDAVARLALLRPAVVDRPEEVEDDDEQVYIGDLRLGDKLALALHLNGGAEAERLATFPDRPGGAAAGVEPLPDGADAGPAPQRSRRSAKAAAGAAA